MKKQLKIILMCLGSLLLGVGITLLSTYVVNSISASYIDLNATKTYNVVAASDTLSMNYSTSFKFKLADFFGANAEGYNADVAKFSLLEALDAQDIGRVRLSSSEDKPDTDNVKFLKSLNFYNVQNFDTSSIEESPNDNTGGVFAAAKDFAGKNVLIVCSIKGTLTVSEWISNLDVGANTQNYTDMTGYKLGEGLWENAENHKGIDVTAAKVRVLLAGYIMANVSYKCKNLTVLFTGYSRGAAIANVCAADYLGDSTYNPSSLRCIAYTFACPTTTTASDCHDVKYKCIYNHVNSDDFQAQLPPSKLGFVRYGKDIVLAVKGNSAVKAKFKTITNTDYYEGNFVTDLVKALNDVTVSREDMYTIDNSENGLVSYRTHIESYARDDYNALVATITNNGLEKYVTLSELLIIPTGTGDYTYGYDLHYAPAFICGIAPEMISIIKSGTGALALLNYLTYLNCPRWRPVRSVIMTYALKTGAIASLGQYHSPAAYLPLFENYWDNL